MYKPPKQMTYEENKPVIVLTNVAKINPKEATPQHLAFQSLLSILILGVFLGFIPSGINAD